MARNLVAGYFWIKFENGYMIFSKDLSDAYFITDEFIEIVRKNNSMGSRLAGFGKLVGSAVAGAFAVTGSVILDGFGSARGAVIENGNVGFPLTSRNAEITGELLRNSWVQMMHNREVVSLPQAIIPVALDIAEKTK